MAEPPQSPAARPNAYGSVLPPRSTIPTFNPVEVSPEYLAELQRSGMFDAVVDRLGLEGYNRTDGVHVAGRLEGKPSGTYIWRLSRQNGGLVISSVKFNGEIVHVLYLLHRDPDDHGGRVKLCAEKTDTAARYTSIVDVITQWPDIYKTCLLDLERTAPIAEQDAAPDDSRYLQVRRTVEMSDVYDNSATRESAERRLEGCPTGTFLIRRSETNPGEYSVSIALPTGACHHSRLSCLRSGFILHDGHRYTSLGEFITSKTECGALGVPLRFFQESPEYQVIAAARRPPPTAPVEVVAPLVVDYSPSAPPDIPMPGGMVMSPGPFVPMRIPVPVQLSPGVIFPSPESPVYNLAMTEPVPSSATASPSRGHASDDETSGESPCVVCLDARIDVLLLECGHVCVCATCAARLAECPMCRGRISRVIKMFHAHK